jgi:hypothetical protein
MSPSTTGHNTKEADADPCHQGANASAKIAIYASGGHYRVSNDIDGLCDDVSRAIGQGHRRFKIKIGGASLASHIKRVGGLCGQTGDCDVTTPLRRRISEQR